MPDGDRFPRGLPQGWRAVGRRLASGEPPEQVGGEVVKALASQLRRSGGIPNAGHLADQLHTAASQAGGDVYLPTPRVGVHGTGLLQQTVERTARKLLATEATELAAKTPTETAERLLVATLRDVALSQGLERVVPDLMAQGRYSKDGAVVLLDECVKDSHLLSLARRLLRRPDGLGLRAPTVTPRAATADLIDRPVNLI